MSFTNPQSPGVYIQVRNIGESVIPGVSTSTMAVFGRTQKGFTDKPYLVTSFEDFQNKFGGYVAEYPDVYNQVMLYFMNGGSRVYVLRMTNGASISNVTIKNSTGTQDTWKIECANEGTWGNDISVKIEEKSPDIYTITVFYQDSVVEVFDDVVFNNALNSNYVLNVVNSQSNYIKISLLVANPDNPEVGVHDLAGGLDGSKINLTQYVGLFTDKKFDIVDEMMTMIVADSSLSSDDYVNLLSNMIAYAENREDIFIIEHIPKSENTPSKAVDFVKNHQNIKSKYCAIYYPTVKFYDRFINSVVDIYPDGAIAGIYARVDADKTVGKSPGGTVDGKLNGISGVSVELTRGDMDVLYPVGINPIINWVQTGLCLWGVRTLSPLNEWRYISNVRTFMFVRKSIYNATHWIVFENNNPTLWFKIKNQLESALLLWFRDGYFAGTKPSDAFYVVCDDTNNPPESINAGIVNIDVGIALNKPAEFVRFRLQQKVNR
jgi:phage tail sheath protein FI